MPQGVYHLGDGIDLPEGINLVGEGAPQLGTFPQAEDDKRFLRPGAKHLLPDSVLLFGGTGTRAATT